MTHATMLTTVAALALSAGAALAEGETIGFSQIGSESGWRAAETTLTRSQAEERGYQLQFSDAQQRQENQIAAIRSFVAQGVDAILLAPVVATGWDSVLQEAAEAEIPVVLLDRQVDDVRGHRPLRHVEHAGRERQRFVVRRGVLHDHG